MKKTVLLFIFFILTGGGIYYSLTHIDFEENITGILPVTEENKLLIEVIDSAGIFDRIIFHLTLADSSSSDPDKLVSAANDLTDSISAQFMPDYVNRIEGKSNPMDQVRIMEAFYKYLPLYMEETDYQRVDSLIKNGNFDHMLAEYLKILNTPAGMVTARFMFRDPLNLVPRQLSRLKSLQVDTNLTIHRNYLFTKDKKHLLFFISPTETKNTGHNSVFITRLDKIISEINKTYDNKVKTEYIGSVPISTANARQIKNDILLTVSISIVLIILLNYYFFRRKRNLLLILLPSFFGAVMALVAFALMKQKVSLIALGIGSVTLGLSIDYALHILTHLKHSRSIRESAKEVGIPLMICSITTVVAFLCLLLLSSPAIRQFATFSAISVMAAAILAIFFIPHVVSQGTKEFEARNITFIEKLASIEVERHGLRLIAIILVTWILFYFSGKASFEQDIEKSNFMPERLSVAGKNLDRVTGLNQKKIYLMSSGNNLDSALIISEENTEILSQLTDQKKINAYNNIQKLVFSTQKQQQKINNWNEFWTSERKSNLKQALERSAARNHFKNDAFNKFYNLLDEEFHVVNPDSLLNEFSLLAGNFKINLSKLIVVASVIRIESPEQKANLENAFKNKPSTFIIDRKDFFTRVFDIIKSDFGRLIGYSSIFGILIILAFFGRIEIALITFVPIYISWIWTLGLLGLTGFKLNFFNVIICNLIFGLGIDYSTFLTKGLIRRYATGSDDFSSHKSSILISLFTTLIGLGVLVLAKHPALRSIAILSVIGLISSVLVSFIIQPTLFKILTEHKGKKRKAPIQFRNLYLSILIFGIFGIMSVISILLLPVIYLLPVKTSIKQLIMRWLVGRIFWVMIRMHWKVRNIRIGITPELFNTPSLMISNHQSMVDIMTYLSISPRIIIITKDWVWNNPIFGLIVRACGHIHIAHGYEDLVDVVKEKTSQGCSILIFPEGSRSRDGHIGRFHKGAFYLAQQLNLPINKFLVHGIGQVLPPGAFMIHEGSVTIKYVGTLKIQNNDPRAYYYASKETCTKMRAAYKELCDEIETPYYLHHQLIANYIYKGPIVENYIKVKVRLEQYYELFDKLVPRKAHIIDIGCGYGPMTYMLCLRSSERNILGIDYDEDKIALAANCELAGRYPVKFAAADATNYPYPVSDVFLISDMLHYLPSDKQKDLITECISKLAPGGMIIIRDGDSLLEKKHLGTRLTEFFSTNLGFNKTTSRLTFFSHNFVEEVAREYNMNLEIQDQSKLTSNRIYILKRK